MQHHTIFRALPITAILAFFALISCGPNGDRGPSNGELENQRTNNGPIPTPTPTPEPGDENRLMAPEHVQAVGEVDAVHVVWTFVPGAQGYRIYRRAEGDEHPVLAGEVDQATTIMFRDRDMTPAGPLQGPELTSPEISHPEYVRLEWSAARSENGPTYDYQVAAVGADGREGRLSAPSSSARAAATGAPADLYEVEIDHSGQWAELGPERFWNDTEIPRGNLILGAVTASLGEDLARIALRSNSVSTDGMRTYRVRGVRLVDDERRPGEPSNAVSAGRGFEEVEYQWQRAESDEPSAQYSPLDAHCVDQSICEDRPEGSPGQYFYYRLRGAADGGTPVYSETVRGSLAVLGLEITTQPPPRIDLGTEFEVFLQLINQYDAPLAINGLPIKARTNQHAFSTGRDEVAVNSNHNGVIHFRLIMERSGTEYILEFTSESTHLEGVQLHSDPFDVIAPPIQAIAAGGGFSLGLLPDGTLQCWKHRLTTTDICGPAEQLTDVVDIAGGLLHAVALHQDGSLTSWPASHAPPNSQGLPDLVAIDAGMHFNVGLRRDGTVAVWRDERVSWTELPDPLAIPAGLDDVVAIDAGDVHVLALRSDGTVVSWPDHPLTPGLPPADLTDVVDIAAGHLQSMALRSDGTVVVWGDGALPAPEGLTDVIAIKTGMFEYLALQADGTVVYWDLNKVETFAFDDVVAIDTEGHALVLLADGMVWAWPEGWD